MILDREFEVQELENNGRPYRLNEVFTSGRSKCITVTSPLRDNFFNRPL